MARRRVHEKGECIPAQRCARRATAAAFRHECGDVLRGRESSHKIGLVRISRRGANRSLYTPDGAVSEPELRRILRRSMTHGLQEPASGLVISGNSARRHCLSPLSFQSGQHRTDRPTRRPEWPAHILRSSRIRPTRRAHAEGHRATRVMPLPESGTNPKVLLYSIRQHERRSNPLRSLRA